MTKFAGSSELPDSIFDPPCERLVVVARELHGCAEGDADAAGPGHLPGVVEHLVQPFYSDWNHRHAEPGRNHPDSGAEAVDLPALGPPALGKDQHREAVLEDLA